MSSFPFQLVSFMLFALQQSFSNAQLCPESGVCVGSDPENDVFCADSYAGGTIEDCVCGSQGTCEWVCDDQRFDQQSLGSCPMSPSLASCSSPSGNPGQVKACEAAITLEDCLCTNDSCQWAVDDMVFVLESLPNLNCSNGKRGGNKRRLRSSSFD